MSHPDAGLEFYERRDPLSITLIAVFVTTMVLIGVRYKFVGALKGPKRLFADCISLLFLVLAIGYGACLVLALTHDEDWFRLQLAKFYPELTERHVETQFDTACAFRDDFIDQWQSGKMSLFEVVTSQFEGYFYCHLFGFWTVCVLFFRDPVLLFMVSLLYEAQELWWERFYSPFRECWWDHCGLDLGANFTGCVGGYLTIKLLGLKPLNIWTWKNITDVKSKQFWFIVAVFCNELVRFPLIFFVPHVMGIPPKHIVNVFRFFMLKATWVNMAFVGGYLKAVRNEASNLFRLRYTRIVCVLLALEIMVVLKFYRGKFLEGHEFKGAIIGGTALRSDEPLMPFQVHLYLMTLPLIVMAAADTYIQWHDKKAVEGMNPFVAAFWTHTHNGDEDIAKKDN